MLRTQKAIPPALRAVWLEPSMTGMTCAFTRKRVRSASDERIPIRCDIEQRKFVHSERRWRDADRRGGGRWRERRGEREEVIGMLKRKRMGDTVKGRVRQERRGADDSRRSRGQWRYAYTKERCALR